MAQSGTAAIRVNPKVTLRRLSYLKSGVLTKGEVDTLLFDRFPYAPRIDLTSFDSLALDTRVPESQGATVELLVILREEGGADYLAETGRMLNVSGTERTWIPFGQFKLAGWSKDPNGRLDLDDVIEIRMGWGGHYGVAGERISFEVSAPASAKLSR